MLAAWDVRGEIMERYKTEVRKKNTSSSPGGQNWVPTFNDAQQKSLRDAGVLDDNEYLLLMGAKNEHLSSILEGGVGAVRDGWGRTFGDGLYLADVIDKANQYCTSYEDPQTKLKGWAWANKMKLGEDVRHVRVDDSADVFYVFVVRAYLGKHLEVQKEGSLASPDGKQHNMWHW